MLVATTIAWALAIIFFTAGLEKLVRPGARRDFVDTVRTVPLIGSPLLACLFFVGESIVLPLLWIWPAGGLNLLVILTTAVTVFALIAWIRGDIESCGCGGIWAASGRNLFLRNLLLLLLAVYARLAAPVPLPIGGLLYALAAIAITLLTAGIAEAIRIRIRTG